MADHDDAYCELSFSPNVSLISTVRRFVGEFYVKVLNSESVTSRLVVATHEVLENAVRYSADGKSRIRIGVTRRPNGFAVRIDTYNKSTKDNQVALLALLDLLKAGANRSEVYQKLMAQSAKRDTGSGLGLGRIYAESEMDLSCNIDAGDVVHLIAEGAFTMEGSRGVTDIANIETPELATELHFSESSVTVRMAGSAETGAMAEVDRFLKRLHDRLVAAKLPEVIIDMRALEFMNSSCFKSFVSWIDRLQQLPPESRYRVRFIYDERKHWQSRSLGALAGFAVDLIQVETS